MPFLSAFIRVIRGSFLSERKQSADCGEGAQADNELSEFRQPSRPSRTLALIALLFVIAGCEPPAPPSSPAPAKPVETLVEEPEDSDLEITFQTVNREQYDAILAEQAGKVILVDFWGTYCGPCLDRFPHLVEFAKKHAEEGLVVVTVFCDDESHLETARDFLRKKKADFIHLQSESGSGQQTFVDFKIKGGALPHYKLYDRRGKLCWTLGTDMNGTASRDELDTYVLELLKEAE